MKHMERTRKIGLGYTAEGYRVVAEISLRDADPERATTSTTHEAIPMPAELGIIWEVVETRRPVNGYYAGGQVGPEDRVITRRHENDATPETAELINALWERWHLNTMHGECAHMPAFDDIVVPDDYTPERPTYGENDRKQRYALAHIVCPESGYRWGHSWLAESMPADVLAQVESLIVNGATE